MISYLCSMVGDYTFYSLNTTFLVCNETLPAIVKSWMHHPTVVPRGP